jgi:hypothetical protein
MGASEKESVKCRNSERVNLPDARKAYGPMMLPNPTPMKMEAEASIFLVLPPTFPVTKDSAKLKTALEAPVRSAETSQSYISPFWEV